MSDQDNQVLLQDDFLFGIYPDSIQARIQAKGRFARSLPANIDI